MNFEFILSTNLMTKLKLPTLIFLLRVVVASPYYQISEHKHKTGHPGVERGSPEFWYHLIASVFLVLAGGVSSGCVHLFIQKYLKC